MRLSDSYIAATTEAKSSSAKMASELLQARLLELKQSLVAANKAAHEFRLANNLISKGSGVTSNEQLSHLTDRLADVKMQLAEAKARVDRIQQQASSEEASGTYPDNQVILALRSKYLELSTQANELASRVGPDHSAVVKLHKEMDTARAAIQDEEKRLAGFYVSAYQAARTQSNELAAMMAQVSEEARTESQPQTTLRQLEGMADSLRDSYKSVLEQFNALKTQPSNPIQDAHIITRASPQLLKSSNKSLAVLGGGAVLGLLLGTGAAVGRELAAGVFRTPEQVKQATGLYCVSLAMVETRGTQTASANPMVLEQFVLDAPHSQFTESLRNIKALVDAAKREKNGDQVIGVVSPVSKNGKSTTVINLAALMAMSARTLVIDGDLHRRQLTAMLEPDAREGLIEALDDPSRLAGLVRTRPRSGVDFLPCVLSKRIPNAAELLGSLQMERVLTAARGIYGTIMVECPPIMSVVDVKMMERFIDRFVFVIEWGQTKRRVVQEALDEIDITRERTLCCVLNKVDPAELRSIEAYKGPQHMAYYET